MSFSFTKQKVNNLEMRRIFLYILLLTACVIQAQIQHTGFPVGIADTSTPNLRSSSRATVIEMPAFDSTMIARVQENNFHKALQFAHPFEVDLSPSNCGQWTTNDDGSRLWQVTIQSNDASSINVIFDKYKLPKGGQIFIYNTEMTHIIGAFTEANNKASGTLPTLPVYGDEIVVEYQEPKSPEFEAEIHINQVNHDYTNIFNTLKTGVFGDSQECEKDVSCYIDDIYTKTSRSTVKLLIDGYEVMTGTLINNSREDGTPYVITAAHGFENHDYSADNTLFIFNYQVPQCYTDLEGTREQSIAGGTMLAYSPKVSGEALDFALLEMSVTPPTAYLPYYAGWSRSESSPSSSFCIHHPEGDVKKISFDDNALAKQTLSFDNINYYPNGHWNVLEWEVGTTEGGSSGSGLFNPSGQFIGGLTGGSASCSNSVNDYFYRFDLAWDSYPESNRQLAYWLDSDSSNVAEMGPYESTEVINTARVSHINESSEITVVNDETNGNIAGNNNLGITHFVEKFENKQEKEILGFYFIAAEGKPSSIVNTTIWTGTEMPEEEVFNEALLIKKWVGTSISSDPPYSTIGGFYPKDSLDMQENFVLFSSPVTVSSNYFIGFEVNNTVESPDFGLVLSYTNSADNAYYYDAEWHSYQELAGYNKSTTLWIDPVVQTNNSTPIDSASPTTLKVYPNPVKSGELLTIEASSFENIAIFDVLGKAYTPQVTSSNEKQLMINVDQLTQGVYIVKVGQEKVLFQKY